MTQSHRSRSTQVGGGAKFDMRINPVYQIDFSNVATGKMVASSKRRVRWRFGFSNAAAIQAGKTGAECRGEEHEVVLIWSFSSGKRIVLVDSKEVHFSVAAAITDVRFETSWSIQGGHAFHLTAFSSAPMFVQPGVFRQFDLMLDGCSFFDMPKIYELGASRGAPLPRALPPAHSKMHIVEEERQFYDRPNDADAECRNGQPMRSRSAADAAVAATAADPPQDLSSAKPRQAPAVVSSKPTQAPVLRVETVPDILSGLDDREPDYLLDQPSTTTKSPSFAPTDEFSPRPVQAPPPPSFALLSNHILSAYHQQGNGQHQQQVSFAPPVLALANEPFNLSEGSPSSSCYGMPPQQCQYQQQYSYPPQTNDSYHGQSGASPRDASYNASDYAVPSAPPGQWSHYQPDNGSMYGNQYDTVPRAAPISPTSTSSSSSSVHASAPWSASSHGLVPSRQEASPTSTATSLKPSIIQPLCIKQLGEDEQPPMSALEKAIQSLVNLDDITESVETPEQIKIKQQKEARQPTQSKPIPPARTSWYAGPNASLVEIAQHTNTTKTAAAVPTREIMRTHSIDPAAATAAAPHAGMMVLYGSSSGTIPSVAGFGAGVHQNYCNYHYHNGGGPAQTRMALEYPQPQHHGFVR